MDKHGNFSANDTKAAAKVRAAIEAGRILKADAPGPNMRARLTVGPYHTAVPTAERFAVFVDRRACDADRLTGQQSWDRKFLRAQDAADYFVASCGSTRAREAC